MRKILIIFAILFGIVSDLSFAADTESNDSLNNYLRTVEQKISKNYKVNDKSAKNITTVLITIDKNGNLKQSEITKSAGITSIDKLANKAIQNAAPFAPLPDDFHDDLMTISISFSDYIITNVVNKNKINKQVENSLQEEFEKKEIKRICLDIPILAKLYIVDDYRMYISDNSADTLYGDINNEAYVLSKKTDYNSKINYKYLIAAKNSISDFYNNKVVKKIIINNGEYQLLNDTTKQAVLTNNIMAIKNDNIVDLSAFSDSAYSAIQSIRKDYVQNKNNIKQNRELYDLINNYIIGTRLNKMIGLAKSGQLQPKNQEDNLVAIFTDVKTKFEDLAKEINDYSYNYEYKKYNDWAKQNNKKIIVDKLFNAVYQPYFQPHNGLYQYIGGSYEYPLQVVQTVPGGVIISGVSGISPSMPNHIFLQTSKQYADGQMIMEPIIAEYKGFYDYTTVFNAHKKIYKFYRYGQSEIDSNFKMPNTTFYFYK